jgi:hypothetical protein
MAVIDVESQCGNGEPTKRRGGSGRPADKDMVERPADERPAGMEVQKMPRSTRKWECLNPLSSVILGLIALGYLYRVVTLPHRRLP